MDKSKVKKIGTIALIVVTFLLIIAVTYYYFSSNIKKEIETYIPVDPEAEEPVVEEVKKEEGPKFKSFDNPYFEKIENPEVVEGKINGVKLSKAIEKKHETVHRDEKGIWKTHVDGVELLSDDISNKFFVLKSGTVIFSRNEIITAQNGEILFIQANIFEGDDGLFYVYKKGEFYREVV